MRITEKQLRRIIREALALKLNEMPYAGMLTGPDDKNIVLPGRPYWSPGETGRTIARAMDPATTSRYIKSVKFIADAESHYAKLPFPVWLAPVLSANPEVTDNFVDPQFSYSRIRVLNLAKDDALEFLENAGFIGLEKINPTGDLVVCPVGLNVIKGFVTSPWVIMHGIFDSLEDSRAIEKLVPGIVQLYKEIDENQSITYDLVRSLTMYAARTNQISYSAVNDIIAEMMMQEIFDKRRLYFNFDKVNNPESQARIIEIGKRVKELAPSFSQNAPGKLILVR